MLLPKMYTVEEANSLVPFITERLSKVRHLVHEGRILKSTMEDAEKILQDGDTHIQNAKTQLLELNDKVHEELHELAVLGIYLKNLDPPIVEVLSRRGANTVQLGWTWSEETFNYWRELDEGFHMRRGIDDHLRFGSSYIQ